jgi:UDP-N-acetylmuramate dehydrogenase
VIEARTRDDLVDALRETWSTGDDWLVVGAAPTSSSATRSSTAPSCSCARRGSSASLARAGFVRVRVEAGHGWDDLVAYAAAEGLSGIVAMSGIPGTVGAAPVQNIGAYGQEIVETLIEVELIDEATGDVSVVPAAELGLGFRTSVLKNHYGSVAERSAVVLSVTLELREVGHGPFALSGAQLRQALGVAEDEGVTLEWVRQTVLATRARKGMVLDDAPTPTPTVRDRSSRTPSSRHPSLARCRRSARAGRSRRPRPRWRSLTG